MAVKNVTSPIGNPLQYSAYFVFFTLRINLKFTCSYPI